MKHFFTTLSLAILMLTGCTPATKTDFDVDAQIEYCHSQVLRSLAELRDSTGDIDYTQAPRNIGPDETKWNLRNIKTAEEWCAGFWPGILWMAGEQEEARRYTNELEYIAYQPVFDHDIGFIMLGSFLKGYEATGDAHYREVLLSAADTLATLWNPQVGTLLSWPRNVTMFGGHNTIIDNMLNLELLLWAALNGGGARLRDIAVAHADTTMHYHFREDFTSYHVAVYDTLTGQHLRNCTHQGIADESLWSRGQAWAIYGYTMMYRYTHEKRYLDFAQKVTDAMLAVLPEDGIPYWDMRDPAIPDTYRDASSACVIADALIELSTYVDSEKSKHYLDTAIYMLTTLSSDLYQSYDRNPAFLMHSVGNYPAGSEIDYSINYADYYYIEALLRLRQI